MDKNRPQPGRVTSPTLTTKVSGTAPIAPRPRSPSITDETTLPGAVNAPKGITPRAPSVSRPDAQEITQVNADARTMAKDLAREVAKELIAPFEARIAELDLRLQSLEKLAARAQAASMPAIATAAAPAVTDTIRTVPSATISGPVVLPASPAIDIPPPPASLSVPISIPNPIIVKVPASTPPPVRASMPSSPPPAPLLYVDDKPLAKHEYSSFDGGKRQRRVAWAFVLVLVALAAALGISFATCQG